VVHRHGGAFGRAVHVYRAGGLGFVRQEPGVVAGAGLLEGRFLPDVGQRLLGHRRLDRGLHDAHLAASYLTHFFPTTSPTNHPTTDCSGAPEWAFGSVYTAGNLVKHEKSKYGDPSGPSSGQGKHLWRAKYWTQGSEPGWTDQWQDMGAC
jgi:hypothetical protein